MPLYPQGGGLYPNSIDNVLLMDMADSTVKGRAKGAGLGDPQDLTAAQLSLLLGGPNFRNILGRNGGFEVWQRGAGGSAFFGIAGGAPQYVADGWFLYASANQGSSVAQGVGLTNGSRYAATIQRSAGQTGVAVMYLEFPLDSDEIALARGNIVTLSMTMYGGPNWSPVGGIITIQLYTGTGTPARRTSAAYTGDTKVIDVTQALTGVATRYSFTSAIVVPAGSTQASLMMSWTPVGTAGAADYFALDDVQLEVGSVATPFERRPFESELLACRRHFYKSFPYAVAPAGNLDIFGSIVSSQMVGASAGVFDLSHDFPVGMRRTPDIVLYNPRALNSQVRNAALNTDCSGAAVWSYSPDRFSLSYTTAPGSAVGQPNCVHYTADAGI